MNVCLEAEGGSSRTFLSRPFAQCSLYGSSKMVNWKVTQKNCQREPWTGMFPYWSVSRGWNGLYLRPRTHGQIAIARRPREFRARMGAVGRVQPARLCVRVFARSSSRSPRVKVEADPVAVLDAYAANIWVRVLVKPIESYQLNL